jgi:cytidylate kinase
MVTGSAPQRTGFHVICISRTVCAEGERIGRTVAQRLGYRYVDEEIITKAARDAQVDPALVAAAEHRRPLLQRLVAEIPVIWELASGVALTAGVPVNVLAGGPTAYVATTEDMRILIRAAIEEVANAGQAVIVAHAASMALAGRAQVLRVLVTASPATRAARLAAEQGLSSAEAAAAVAASDRERRDYFQRFYHIRDELPTHYDLVLNTDILPPERAADLIVTAAQN